MVRFVLLVFLSVSIISPTIAQVDLNLRPKIFSIRSHYGFIIPHSEELKEISDTNPWGIQVDYSRLLMTEESWNNCNCFAQVGFSFEYFNYGNPSVLGNSYNFIYFAEPYLGYKSDLFTSFRVGIGATLLDQVYDAETNPQNTFYSSTLSFLLLLNLNANYRLNDQYFLTLSANYNHISNGGMKQPNRGMNFPTMSFGVNYSPDFEGFPSYEKVKENKGTWRGYTRLFGTLPGVQAEGASDNKRVLLLGASGGVFYHLSHIIALGAGVEFVYDGSLRERAERLGEDLGSTLSGFTVSNNIIFGRWSFNQHYGIYLHKPEQYREENFFQRYELLYRVGERYQIGTSLKAHGHVADNWDVRLGILF